MQNVTYGGRELGFLVNSNGVIDVTHYFHTAEFMAGGPSAWALTPLDVRALLLHHTAGFFGTPPPTSWRTDAQRDAVRSAEFAQLVSLAKFHYGKYGIGPAYNLAVFGSGTVWAIGRHGTHRAHTAGREPQSRVRWNETGRAIVVFGNFETDPVTAAIASGIRIAVREARGWPGVRKDAPIHEHGLTPSVNSNGTKYPQATLCPGRNLAAWRAQGGLHEDGVPSFEPDRWGEGYVAGHRYGYGAGALAAGSAYRGEYEEAAERVAALIASPPAPHVPPTPARAQGQAVAS